MSLNIKSNVANFVTEIDRLISVHGLDTMDAVVYYCEQNNMELETAAAIVKSNAKLKSKIQIEAEDLNYLPKKSRLPGM